MAEIFYGKKGFCFHCGLFIGYDCEKTKYLGVTFCLCGEHHRLLTEHAPKKNNERQWYEKTI